MPQEFVMVEKRLDMWAAWYVSFFENELGWPKQSSFLNIPMGKGESFTGKTSGGLENDLAAEINTIILALHRRRPAWHDVVKIHYTEQGFLKDKAKKLGIHRHKYMERLKLGKVWIEAKIGKN